MAVENNPQTTEEKVATPQKPTNCVICNKPLRRIKRYYHAGKFYCSKGCYKRSRAKSKEANKEKKDE